MLLGPFYPLFECDSNLIHKMEVIGEYIRNQLGATSAPPGNFFLWIKSINL